MNLRKRWLRKIRARIGFISRRRRVLAVLGVLLVLAGCVWLLGRPVEPEMAAVLDEPLAPEEMATARKLLETQGVSHRIEDGAVFVRPEHVGRVRAMLACEGLLPHSLTAGFERLAGEGDIWRTEAQNAKRWQAAKMAALSRLISMLPSVRSATVLFEPGIPRRLGAPRVGPTAAVKVHLAGDKKMTPKLTRAIADLVAGSIAGMNRQNVRIVDNTGRSYRVSEPDSAAGADHIERLREAETYYREKILAALSYIDNLAVGVHVAAVGGEVECLGASVSLPRSYLAGVYRAAHEARDEVGDEQIQAVAAPQLAKVRQVVMKVIGVGSTDVAVDWYYDTFAARCESEFAPAGAVFDSTPPNARTLTAGALAIMGGVCALGALRRRRRRRAARPGATPPPRAKGSRAVARGADRQSNASETADGPFDFLRQAAGEDLLALLAPEHPQTVALALAHLQPARAAEVLTGLSPERQIEVAHRLAAMEQMDGELSQEIAESLSGRLADVTARRQPKLGGVGAVVEILRRTGCDTEAGVLAGITDADPALAESIRSRMFAFEDIADIPSARLRGAMELLDSDELAVALRTAGQKVKRKIFSCLSPDAARRVRDETRRMSPVRLSDVEAAQQQVVEAVRRVAQGEYVSAMSGGRSELLA